MIKIAAFSKFLGYKVGGAEQSLISFLKDLERDNKVQISVVYCDGLKAFSASDRLVKFPSSWNVITFAPTVQLQRFPFREYLFNKLAVQSFFSVLNADVLYAQGLWAPAAILAFEAKTVRMVRSEHDLNIWGNYHNGIRRFVKCVYQAIERGCFRKFCADNKLAFERTDTVIANSHYMAQETNRIFQKDVTVRYPDVDGTTLKAKYREVVDQIYHSQKAIIMVGDTVIKGAKLFQRIACQFPTERFIIFGRSYKETKQCKNITYMPWQEEPVDVFKWAKLVLVPSVCNEAFGRVALEARLLDIPVIVTNMGGLPEAVDFDQNYIANGYIEMLCKVRSFLSTKV